MGPVVIMAPDSGGGVQNSQTAAGQQGTALDLGQHRTWIHSLWRRSYIENHFRSWECWTRIRMQNFHRSDQDKQLSFQTISWTSKENNKTGRNVQEFHNWPSCLEEDGTPKGRWTSYKATLQDSESRWLFLLLPDNLTGNSSYLYSTSRPNSPQNMGNSFFHRYLLKAFPD